MPIRRPTRRRRSWLAVAGTVVAALVAALALLGFGRGALETERTAAPDHPAPAEQSVDSRGASDAAAPRDEAVLAPGEARAETDAAARGDLGADRSEAEAGTPAPRPVGDPERIEIPAIAVDAEVVPIGLRDDGAMEVPDFGLAGWYTEAPRPGEEGPSTVVAHVDSRSGPDVFARLRELEAGDEVRVHGEDGTVTFVVEASESAPKDDLPAERIWGWTDEPTLRLITCGGQFDHSTGHYEDNHIVYLALAAD